MSAKTNAPCFKCPHCGGIVKVVLENPTYILWVEPIKVEDVKVKKKEG
ncbi:hypothetical protein ES702_00772 [subsurface metagenome]